jgi:hypothetical protein
MKHFPLFVAIALVSCSKQPEPAAPASAPKIEVQYATPVAGMPGYVTSPYSPKAGYIDVRGFPPSTEVKDPYSGKMFKVP